jgi:Fic-DOC domain mobile mystery protein B
VASGTPTTLIVADDPLAPRSNGQTPLSEEDRDGLILSYIATRRDLEEAEQRNIINGTLGLHPTVDTLLDDAYLRALHRRMFGDVWTWAGKYRTSDTNIGVSPELIPGAVRDVVLDTRAWIEYGTFEPDELAVRFHHRLVSVHPFPNGNGRHSRTAADLLIVRLAARRFSWGSGTTASTPDLRAAYMSALRAADEGDVAELVAFARS